MILVDPPRWPAHGTLFSHLVSDSSLSELHLLAAAIGLSPRAFDHDHYDVPERLYDPAIAAARTCSSDSEVSETRWENRVPWAGQRGGSTRITSAPAPHGLS